MTNVLLTGISGLLGQVLAKALTHQGYAVFGLVRKPQLYKGFEHENLSLVKGDLFSDLKDVLTKTEIVVHAAAETRQGLLHYSDYDRVNYKGTVLLYQMARIYGVSCFVFISTANTMGHGSAQFPAGEGLPPSPPFVNSLYARSKINAENFLLKQDKRMKIIILNPTFILGYKAGKQGSNQIIKHGLNKKLIFCPPGGKNFVHPQDVAWAVLYSIHSGATHQRYLVAGENHSYYEFYQLLRQITHQKCLLIKIPGFVLIALGLIGELMRFAGMPVSFSRNNMQILCEKNYYSKHFQLSKLGLKPQTTVLAMQDYFIQHKDNQPKRTKVRWTHTFLITVYSLPIFKKYLRKRSGSIC